jgi:ribosomal protein S18 acetylase RimI-like enzyme
MKSELRFVEVSSQDFWSQVTPWFESIYSNRLEQNVSAGYSENEKIKLRALSEGSSSSFRLFVLIYMNNEFVGWHFGEQTSPDEYYMRNSAILEGFRGQGYYEAMLKHMVGLLIAKGFQVLTSKHHPNNPAVLIPKIRSGFLITATELDDRFGFLVTLKYFTNEARRAGFCRRAGLVN